MRTLNIHTADDLTVRWKKAARALDEMAVTRGGGDPIARHLSALDRERAQAYLVCAAELAAIVAASMELEAAHHGDPEPRDDIASGNVWPD